jgi:hypothetical protein
MEKLIPYSVYLPKEYHDKLREYAKKRKASSIIRDSICMILDGGDLYKSGYKKGLQDAVKKLDSCKEIGFINIKGKYLNDFLAEQIMELGK